MDDTDCSIFSVFCELYSSVVSLIDFSSVQQLLSDLVRAMLVRSIFLRGLIVG